MKSYNGEAETKHVLLKCNLSEALFLLGVEIAIDGRLWLQGSISWS